MRRLDALRGTAALTLTMSPTRAVAANPDVVRFSTIALDAIADLYTAKFRGFLTRVGIEPELTVLPTGNVIMASLVAGAFEIGRVNMLSLAQAREKGIALQPIALGAEYTTIRPTAALIVANDSPLRRAAHLNDKTVSVNELSGITQIGARTGIEAIGVASATPSTAA